VAPGATATGGIRKRSLAELKARMHTQL
jgi:hypothetical protein